MSSGIFGSRTPSYPIPSNYHHSFQSSYARSSYTSPSNSYPPRMSYGHQPQATCPQTLYPSPAYHPFAYPQPYGRTKQVSSPSPNTCLPSYPVYPQGLPYYSNSQYVTVLPNTGNYASHGLEAILIAILVLVSLDLIFVRPLKEAGQ